MTPRTKSTETKSAYGKELPEALPYSYSWDDYDDFAELKAANNVLSDDEQVKVRNRDRENNSRQKSYQKALDDAAKRFEEKNGKDVLNPYVKPTEENDDQLRLKNMFKTLMSSKKYTEEQARETAARILQVAWAE